MTTHPFDAIEEDLQTIKRVKIERDLNKLIDLYQSIENKVEGALKRFNPASNPEEFSSIYEECVTVGEELARPSGLRWAFVGALTVLLFDKVRYGSKTIGQFAGQIGCHPSSVYKARSVVAFYGLTTIRHYVDNTILGYWHLEKAMSYSDNLSIVLDLLNKAMDEAWTVRQLELAVWGYDPIADPNADSDDEIKPKSKTIVNLPEAHIARVVRDGDDEGFAYVTVRMNPADAYELEQHLHKSVKVKFSTQPSKAKPEAEVIEQSA